MQHFNAQVPSLPDSGSIRLTALRRSPANANVTLQSRAWVFVKFCRRIVRIGGGWAKPIILYARYLRIAFPLIRHIRIGHPQSHAVFFRFSYSFVVFNAIAIFRGRKRQTREFARIPVADAHRLNRIRVIERNRVRSDIPSGETLN